MGEIAIALAPSAPSLSAADKLQAHASILFDGEEVTGLVLMISDAASGFELPLIISDGKAYTPAFSELPLKDSVLDRLVQLPAQYTKGKLSNIDKDEP